MKTVILAILLLPASLWGQGVVFNEIDANPLGGSSHEFVELHNAASVPVDVSGWEVTSGIEYVFGEGTVIPAGGYLVLAKDPLVFATRFTVPANVLVGGYRFTLDNSGETIRLLDADGVTRDQVRYGSRFPWPDTTPPMPGASGTSLERLCARAGGNASSNWRANVLRGPTPGARNNSVQCPPPVYVAPPVVINEIFYDSLERPDSETEFIELQNTTNQSVDISDWQFTDGIVFTFPSNTVLPPSGLLVVARNADAIKARHGITNVVGNYTNRLADTGEWIELSNKDLVPVEAVRYSDGSSWPPAAAGFEFSLEKLNPRADPTDPASWRSAIGEILR